MTDLLDDVEKAVFQAYDHTASQEARQMAMNFLSLLSESPQGWKIYIEKIYSTCNPQIAFPCLLAIHDIVVYRYPTFPHVERHELQQSLLQFLARSLGPATPQMFQNKLAQILAHVFNFDYLEHWTTFFQDIAWILLNTSNQSSTPPTTNESNTAPVLPTKTGVHIWLSILTVIHEEIISTRGLPTTSPINIHANTLKDQMRLSVVKDLSDIWYQLLLAFYDKDMDVILETLDVIILYIHWIDINVILNEKYLQLLFKLASISEYTAKVLDCYQAFLLKGMNRAPSDKLQLINTLQIPNLLSMLELVETPILLSKIALLVNALGIELLILYRVFFSQPSSISTYLDETLNSLLHLSVQSLLKYLSKETHLIAKQLVDFTRHYIAYLRRMKKRTSTLPPDKMEHLHIMVQILYHRMRYYNYPDQKYDFEHPGENEHEFDLLRRDLADLFRQITQIEPQLVLNHVGALITNIDKMEDPLDMEIAIFSLHLLGQGKHESSESTRAFILQMIQYLINSKIFNYTEPYVLICNFFLCVTRYAKLLINSPQLLSSLLSLWTQKQGILHPHPSTRVVLCSSFSQFVKILKTSLQPYLTQLITCLKPLVNFHPESFQYLTIEEQLDLFELLSVLVGLETDPIKLDHFLDTLLVVPLQQQVVQIIEQQLYLNDTPENPFYKKWLACLIKAMGTFSKGFPLAHTKVQKETSIIVYIKSIHSVKVVDFFSRNLELVVQVYSLLGQSEPISTSVLFYLKRMVVCLPSSHLIPVLLTLYPRILHPITLSNIHSYIFFLIKLIGVYTLDMKEFIDMQFSILLQHIVHLINDVQTQVTVQSDEELELFDFKRQYYYFLFILIQHQLTPILYSCNNSNHLQDIFNTIFEGCGSLNDPVIQRYTFQIITMLIQQWLGPYSEPSTSDSLANTNGEQAILPLNRSATYPLPDSNIIQSFTRLLYQRVLPHCFTMTLGSNFNLDQVKTNEIIYELAALEKALLLAQGVEFENYLMQLLIHQGQESLTSERHCSRILSNKVTSDGTNSNILRCTPEFITQYIHNLKEASSNKALKLAKLGFISSQRRSIGQANDSC